MAVRSLLHRSDLNDFAEWAVKNGFTEHPPKGVYEALRIKKMNRWIIIYDRHRGDHFTVMDKDHNIIRAYYHAKKKHTPAPSGISREDFWI